jgi:hypothetical protein
MSITLAVGTAVAIASTYGSASNMSAISNAASAVATLAGGHSVVVGDFLEITSGWSLLSGRIARVSAVSTNDVTLEGINTSNTTNYPAGTGTGSIRRITAWTTISQITSGISSSGGDQQFADVTTLQDRNQRQIPTRRSPVTLTLPVFADEALAWVATVRAASESASPAAVRLVYPNNSRTVANGYWSMSDINTIQDDTLRSQITIAFAAQSTNYAT